MQTDACFFPSKYYNIDFSVMNDIRLNHTLPRVFSSGNVQSEIWNNDVVLQKGEIYLIEASSGAGKSSLCSFISGYRKDFSGTILFDGVDVSTFTIKDWVDVRSRHLSLVFQELKLFPELTAIENVLIKNQLTNHKTLPQIEEWFSAVGLGDKLNSKVCEMSFGQQQRVAILRALSQPFDFLLADEPVSHLDDANAHIISEILLTEAKAQGATIVVTSIGKRMNLPYNKIFCL